MLLMLVNVWSSDKLLLYKEFEMYNKINMKNNSKVYGLNVQKHKFQ